ncbi:MAG: glycoside hydrolase family 95-like protein [Cyclobacteriaceae bacterium]
MLLQSYAGFIDVMPAVPSGWKDISFDKLRAEGTFLVSATKTGGELAEIKIVAEHGGKTKLSLHDTNQSLDRTLSMIAQTLEIEHEINNSRMTLVGVGCD